MSWEKGQSGNPEGRRSAAGDGKPGKRQELRRLLEPHTEEAVQTLLGRMREGDGVALRVFFDRVIPTLRPADAPASPIPELATGTLSERAEAAMALVAEGRLTPTQGREVAQTASAFVAAAEVEDLKRRLKQIEQALGPRAA